MQSENLEVGTIVIILPSVNNAQFVGRLAVVAATFFVVFENQQYVDWDPAKHKIEDMEELIRLEPLDKTFPFKMMKHGKVRTLPYGVVKREYIAPVTGIEDEELNLFLELVKQDEANANRKE